MREYIFDITPFNYFTMFLMHENKYFNKWKKNPIPLHLHYNVLNVCKVGGKSFFRFKIYLVFTDTDVQKLNLINRSEKTLLQMNAQAEIFITSIRKTAASNLDLDKVVLTDFCGFPPSLQADVRMLS
jgi:hypothetical protein